MANLTFDSDKKFILGETIIKAAISFSISINNKLIPYDFPFAQGVHYEDLGEGEVTLTIEGLLLNFENIGNSIINDINDLQNELLKQQQNNSTIKFVHPDLKAENIKIKSIVFDQTGDVEGFKFKIEMVRHSQQSSVEQTQASLESNFDAQIINSDINYTIIQGDTLWGISQRFLGSGLLWRKLYNYKDNQTRLRSGNPNLIFPNEVILVPKSIT